MVDYAGSTIHTCQFAFWSVCSHNFWLHDGQARLVESWLLFLITSQFAHWFGVIGTICLQKPVRNQMLIDFVLCNQPFKKQDLFLHPTRHHHFLSYVLASRDPVERKHTGSCLGIDSPNQIMPLTLNGEIPRISRGAHGKYWEIWNDTRKTFYD